MTLYNNYDNKMFNHLLILLMIYVDNYNPVLISVFVSILISIASLITILVFFYKGKGNNYLILK